MALITPSPLVDQIKGSIAGVTFQRTLAGAGARARIAGGQPRTTEQKIVRNYLGVGAAAYKALDDSQIGNMSAYAATISILNGLGGSFTPKPGMVSSAINSLLLYAGEDLNDPTDPYLNGGKSTFADGFNGPGNVIDVSSDTLNINTIGDTLHTGTAGSLCLIWIGQPIRVSRPSLAPIYKFAGLLTAPVTTPATISLASFPYTYSAGQHAMVKYTLLQIDEAASGRFLYPITQEWETTVQA